MKKYKCARCGQDNATVISDDKMFCSQCIELFGTCLTCINSRKCEFFSNPSSIPTIITQRIRQQTEHGYVEQIVQVPNPERARTFCLDAKCICCKTCEDGKVRCMRQFDTCENYKEIEF